jgi:hypothetical protein
MLIALLNGYLLAGRQLTKVLMAVARSGDADVARFW